MKIHCIVATKNESDIIEYSLTQAAKWADHIYVYDNMSTDGTWEILQSMRNPKIVAWKQHSKPFREGVRADVYNEFRNQSEDGDWWLRLDADEFYPYDPKVELSKEKDRHAFLWGIEIKYVLTHEDLQRIDFNSPIESRLQQLRYYTVAYSEPRWFRHRKNLVWMPEWAWPKHVGITSERRLPYKHYQYRSPQQIQMRLDVRRAARANGFPGWDHAAQERWQEKIFDVTDCRKDDGDGGFSYDAASLPRHLEPRWARAVKRVMYGLRIWA
jgi:glycosyltransferase involved in cell wall biosynthesis